MLDKKHTFSENNKNISLMSFWNVNSENLNKIWKETLPLLNQFMENFIFEALSERT